MSKEKKSEAIKKVVALRMELEKNPSMEAMSALKLAAEDAVDNLGVDISELIMAVFGALTGNRREAGEGKK